MSLRSLLFCNDWDSKEIDRIRILETGDVELFHVTFLQVGGRSLGTIRTPLYPSKTKKGETSTVLPGPSHKVLVPPQFAIVLRRDPGCGGRGGRGRTIIRPTNNPTGNVLLHLLCYPLAQHAGSAAVAAWEGDVVPGHGEGGGTPPLGEGGRHNFDRTVGGDFSGGGDRGGQCLCKGGGFKWDEEQGREEEEEGDKIETICCHGCVKL